MTLYLVHHGEAVGPDVDPRRPLSSEGAAHVERLARSAASRGAKPAVIWHSGKLRAKQTAEAFWKACNPFAVFEATRDLQPDDTPLWMRDRLRGEPRDLLIAGHFPHLPRLLGLLMLPGAEAPGSHVHSPSPGVVFPPHGIIALGTDDEGEAWGEVWREV